MDDLRRACATVAQRARSVRINEAAIPAYAASLPLDEPPGDDDDRYRASREATAAFWLTLDAINFGSGWFPTLKKLPGRSGYDTVATGIRRRFEAHGPWPAGELAGIRPADLAAFLGQDPEHELMALFAHSLNDLGRHIDAEFDGQFAALADSAHHSAVRLAQLLGTWTAFADTSTYAGITLPFVKRAQIAAADLARAGVTTFTDLDRLTMFADNMVPHVLRLDGILAFDRQLTERIDREDLIPHNSPQEVEIRACAVHAVELIVAQRPTTTAAAIDELLWNRGRAAGYKARPRHRSRCTAY
jgi:hypothetical protein